MNNEKQDYQTLCFRTAGVVYDRSRYNHRNGKHICEEILRELTYVEQQISEGDSAISGMTAQNTPPIRLRRNTFTKFR